MAGHSTESKGLARLSPRPPDSELLPKVRPGPDAVCHGSGGVTELDRWPLHPGSVTTASGPRRFDRAGCLLPDASLPAADNHS